MLIRYLSDIHLELLDSAKIQEYINAIKPNGEDVCVLAGDIGQPNDLFMNHISQNFPKTFIIAGNHEHYNTGRTIEETTEFLANYYQKYPNISFLNNSIEYYNGYCFVGTTLWSHITMPDYVINDVYAIRNFSFIKCNQLNRESIGFLEETSKRHENLIVITHHMPSFTLIDPIYKTPPFQLYNQWFACNLDKFIEANKDRLKCWIYGHTHKPSNKLIHGIPFVCNPIGYLGENKKISFNETVEIEFNK